MDKKYKSVCFSGHRASKLPKSKGNYIEMLKSLENSIEKAVDSGYSTFYTGLCNGFDLLAAEKVLEVKDVPISLVGVIPYRGQADEWSSAERLHYHSICGQCMDLVVLNESKVKGCYYQRNRYMVDRSQLLICYCASKRGGTAYTFEYAEKQGLYIDNIYKK